MPFFNQSTKDIIVANELGLRVDGAAKSLPASTTQVVFTVTGGRVLITAMIATVTTAIQAQANAMKYTGTPLAGTAVDLCTTAETNNAELGAKFVLPAAVGSALAKTLNGAANLVSCNILLEAGTTILQNCAATNAGAMQHTLWYMPLDPGAAVAAN
jgi:hypothetical protein